jgi:hypothetical protein
VRLSGPLTGEQKLGEGLAELPLGRESAPDGLWWMAGVLWNGSPKVPATSGLFSNMRVCLAARSRKRPAGLTEPDLSCAPRSHPDFAFFGADWRNLDSSRLPCCLGVPAAPARSGALFVVGLAFHPKKAPRNARGSGS